MGEEMLVALLNSARVLAGLAQKGPSYSCPGCGQAVTLKKGTKVVHHFAHKPPVTCSWAQGETAAHMAGKLLFLNHFRSVAAPSDVEFPIGNQRADVYATNQAGHGFVFEIQHQPISELEIARRTQEYFRSNVAVTWVPLIDIAKLKDKKVTSSGYVVHRYSPKPFEKWLHGFNFGELWFVDVATSMLWQGRFEKSMIEVPLSEWHVSGGGTESAGGYSRVSKRWRKLSLTGPYSLGQLKIARALRKQGSMGSHIYPQGQRVTFAPR